MSEDFTHADQAVYAKTAIGRQEIGSRALGLSPMQRRLLILIDGKRTRKELEPMASGQDLIALLETLREKNCIEQTNTTDAIPTAPQTRERQASPAPAQTATLTIDQTTDTDLAQLPPAESRGAAEVTMARNFMTNTVNTIFQPYTRLTLLEAIANCKTAEDARRVYAVWNQTIGSSAIGAKRLPEFHEKLFKVL